MKINCEFDLDFTASILAGYLIIFTGLISLFALKDAGLASTCIVTGAGLVAVAKTANTVYDNSHIDKTITKEL